MEHFIAYKPNVCSYEAVIAIHYAVMRLDYERVEELLEMGVNANAKHRLLGTPLESLTRSHDMTDQRALRIRDLLIENGLPPHIATLNNTDRYRNNDDNELVTRTEHL